MSAIEYVYSAHSAYAYLGSAELRRLCDEHGATLVHRPIVLSPVMEAQGGVPFASRHKAHVDYFFGREIERWAEYRGVAVLPHRPTQHDADYALASGMIIALGPSGTSVDRMAHALLQAHWRDDADLSSTDALAEIAHRLGHSPESLLKKAGAPETQAALKANTDWACQNGIFGSPTYIVDGDPFYGQDHLALVARALREPFTPTHWTNSPAR